MKKLAFGCVFAAFLVSCGNKEADLSVKTEPVAGSTVKSAFRVWGNCEMCKETIEGSLQVDGVTEANWNVESKVLSVTYDTTRIDLDQVEKNVAAAGYDNVKYKGDDKAYDNLPDCCKYDRK